MYSWTYVLLSAIAGFIIGRLLAHRLALGHNMRFSCCIACLAIIGYLLCSWLLSLFANSANAHMPENDSNNDVTMTATTEIPKPVIDIGLQPFPLTISKFRDQYNHMVTSRYPAFTNDIRIPDLPVEKGLINDVLRYKNHIGIVLSISAQKHNHQIDEITWMTSDHPPTGSLQQMQAMIIAAVYTITNANVPIDHDMSALFVEAMTTPDVLVERYVDDIQITVMLNASGNIIARLSRPAEPQRLPHFFLYEEDY